MQCKQCKFSSSSQDVLLKQCHLHHGKGSHWPCIHVDYVCTFKTSGALRSHLSRSHKSTVSAPISTFQCELCEFKEICSETTFWNHLANHLRNRETVQCPILRCHFKTNIHPTFTSHRSCHCTLKDFRTVGRGNTEVHGSDGELDDCEAGVSLDEELDECEAGLSLGSDVNCADEPVENVDSETLKHKLASLFCV